MTRRWALAAAFLLTIVAGFLIVSYGSSTGVFAWADRGGQGTVTQQAAPSTSAADIVVGDPQIPVDQATATGPSGEHHGDDGAGEHGDGGEREGGDHD